MATILTNMYTSGCPEDQYMRLLLRKTVITCFNQFQQKPAGHTNPHSNIHEYGKMGCCYEITCI